MAVYNDVEGCKICSFGKWRICFAICNHITVPKDHVMEATGDLMNRSEVLLLHRLKDGNLLKIF
jgi:hypothetical protein